LSIRAFFVAFGIGLFATLAVYSFINYSKNSQTLLEKERLDLITKADRVRYQTSSMIDDISHRFVSTQKLHTKIYQEIADEIVTNPATPLQDIKKRYEERYNDRIFNIYLINRDLVIYDTTYEPDMGLDFKKILPKPELRVLESVYDREIDLDISQPMIEGFSGSYIQYFLHRPKDRDFMVQLGVMFDKDRVLNSFYEEVATRTPSLMDFAIYSFYWYGNQESGRIVKSSLGNNFAQIYKDKNELGKNWLEAEDLPYVSEEFPNVYEGIFGEPMPKEFLEVEGRLQEELKKSGGYLSCTSQEGDRYFRTVLLPMSNFQTFAYKFILSRYIVMKFDVTRSYQEIENYKLQNIIFNLAFLAIIIALFIIVYKRVLLPMKALEDSMREAKVLEYQKKRKDEMGFMIDSYNDLLLRLKKEVDKNRLLLDENKRFIADTVHQIRTPLTSILMSSEMVRTHQNDSSVSSYVERIEAAVNMLSNSYEDLAYVTTYDSIEYRPTHLSLSNLLRERIKFFQTISKISKKEVLSRIDEDISVYMNHIECERLIDNNLSNAFKYADSQKPIRVSLYKRDGEIVLEFSSCGKPLKNPSRVFERNYRENEAKRGLGLGLNMVKNICEKYGINYSLAHKEGQNVFIYEFYPNEAQAPKRR